MLDLNKNGFFFNKIKAITHVINTKFKTGEILNVKNIRKLLNINSKNKSEISFLTKGLNILFKDEQIELIENITPKNYRKIKTIII